MSDVQNILIGGTAEGQQLFLNTCMATRHGLITGATGTGKTVTLQTLAEGFSSRGVPVFTADIKGDLAGLSQSGGDSQKVRERVAVLQISQFAPSAFPVIFWDLYGQKGHPVRTTVSEVGPLLLSSMLELNDTQEGVLYIAFRLADDQGMLLLDLKDLGALLEWISDNHEQVSKQYGNVSAATIASIQRRLLVLREAGAERFFGEPVLKIAELMRKDLSGKGVINILDATTLINQPRLYAMFLLWLLSELFEELEEVGDGKMPRLVFFFDEAHLLFNSAPKELLEKIEQVVRLIRSKGVGIYFVTQHPLDVPDTVLGQLGNRVQHALRAFTPRDQKAVKTAAQTFCQNPKIDTEKVITELLIGEALVSLLDEQGRPTPVERVFILPPASRVGAISNRERHDVLDRSPVRGVYDEAVDRDSAFEILKRRGEEKVAGPTPQASSSRQAGIMRVETQKVSTRQTPTEAFFKSVLRSVGSQVGREIARGVLGSIMGGRR